MTGPDGTGTARTADLSLLFVTGDPPSDTRLGESVGCITLDIAGEMSIQVRSGDPVVATVRAPAQPSPSRMLHPVMGFVGAAAARLAGRIALHAAALVVHQRAWVVTAPPEGGKSSLAVAADAAGIPVLSDDVVVLDGRLVLAGPRTADLRTPPTVTRAGTRTDEGGRRRWRVELGAVPAAVPLGGLVSLEWADELAVTPLRGQEKLKLLASAEALSVGPPTPGAYLDLLDVPGWAVSRPRSTEGPHVVVDLLVAAISGGAGIQPR